MAAQRLAVERHVARCVALHRPQVGQQQDPTRDQEIEPHDHANEPQPPFPQVQEPTPCHPQVEITVLEESGGGIRFFTVFEFQ